MTDRGKRFYEDDASYFPDTVEHYDPLTKADWDETKHPRQPAGGARGGQFMSVSDFEALPDYSEDPEGELDGAEPGDVKSPLPIGEHEVFVDAMVVEGVQVHARVHTPRSVLEDEYMAVGEFSPGDGDLVTYQSVVGKEKVLDIVRNGPSNPNEPLPNAARYKGQFILLDGNHRVTASFLQGRNAQVNIFFADKYLDDHPRLKADWEGAYKMSKADWDESKHPRHPAGTEDGGEFRSAEEHPAEAALRQHRDAWYKLAEQTGIAGEPGSPGYFENWLLEEGEPFGLRVPLPEGVEMGPQKMCYMNSFDALMHGAVNRDEWYYTEGVITIPGLPITIEHAWLSNQKGEILDLTLRSNDDSVYFGIPYSYEFTAERVIDKGHYGLHSNGIHRYPDLVGQPVGEKRAWPKGKRS